MRNILSIAAMAIMLLLFVIAPAFALAGGSEVEPNDTRAQADSIDGLTIDGAINERDHDDWYVLQGQEGTNPTFTMTFDADTLEVDWEVFSDDEAVATQSAWGSPDSVAVQVPGTCYIHVWWWSGSGDYSIDIEPAAEGDDCAGASEVEPNDSKDLADLIDGMEIKGYMCENDEDWYKLDGQEGTNPTFTLSFDAEGLEMDWEIISDDEVIQSMTDYGSPEEITARVPGTCYLHIWWWSGEGPYKVKIEP
jgi:hypothetical protein